MKVGKDEQFEDVITSKLGIDRIFLNGDHFQRADGTEVKPTYIPRGLTGIAASLGCGSGTRRELDDNHLAEAVGMVGRLEAKAFELLFVHSYHSAGVYVVSLYQI